MTAAVETPEQEAMLQLIEKTWFFNRVPISDEMDQAVKLLAEELPFKVHEFPSDEQCLTWTMPKQWDVEEAYIETLSGERIIDFKDNPMAVFAYSCPFEGVVTKDQLEKHLLFDKNQPETLVYHYRFEYQYGDKKDWGFAIPYAVFQQMTDKEYKVVLKAKFSKGTMKVLDFTLEGESPRTVFIGAHTCHPAQVNDGIAACAVGIELFKYLKSLKNRKYTYRLILGPEYFAAAGLLSLKNEPNNLAYGVYLDMLGNGADLCYSHSFNGNSYIDQIMRNNFKYRKQPFEEYPYRGLWGNDEMFYDGPSFEIPMIGLGRKPTKDYHHSTDDLEHCDFNQLEDTLNSLKEMVSVFEQDVTIKRLYEGPLHLSRYNLYIDSKTDPEGYSSIQAIQILMDQGLSLLDIARKLDISFKFVRQFADELIKHNLAEEESVIR